jgi:hypothetical protein
MASKAALLGLLALLAGCARENQEAGALQGRAVASAAIDREQVAFGDDLTLTLEVRSDPSLEVELPHVGEIEGFRVLDAGTTRADQGGVRVERRWHRLRAERAGAQTLPALTARYRPAPAAGAASGAPADGDAGWTAVSTAPITLEVRSLLPAADQPPEIRDIKPLQPIQRARPWVWIAIAVVVVMALAAAAAWGLRRRRGEAEMAPAAPPVPAHEVALAALARLAESEPAGDAEVRRYYFALSEIVRAYLEGRFGLNATDLTTEEILASFHRLPLEERAGRGLRAFLADSDRVKFAAHRPERSEIAAILDWARRFVEETRPVEPEAAEAEAAAREAA